MCVCMYAHSLYYNVFFIYIILFAIMLNKYKIYIYVCVCTYSYSLYYNVLNYV